VSLKENIDPSLRKIGIKGISHLESKEERQPREDEIQKKDNA
jgi:hypothetical protein